MVRYVQHHNKKTVIDFQARPWFATTMSTGSLAVVIGNSPNSFPGLNTIGKIFFIVDLVLFILFTVLMGSRFVIVPRKWCASLHHPVEGLFFGTYWVSLALILSCIQIYGVPSTGPWLVKTMEILFWIYCGLVLLVAVFQYTVLFSRERLNVADAIPAWIFPIYPLLTVGVLAGSMIPSQPEYAAYPMWVGSVMLEGLAWTVSLMMYTIYTQRLMSSALPTPSTRPGMFVSVGPAGYTSAALISLATQAPKVLPALAFSDDSTFSDGLIVKIIGILAGCFIFLFSFWFFCVSVTAVIAGIREMSFTLNWWAFIFPNAGLNLAAIELGKVFSSSPINAICNAMTIVLVVLWFIVALAHIRALWQLKIMFPGQDEDADMKDH